MNIAVCIQNNESCEILTQLFKLYQEKTENTLQYRFFKNDIDLIYDFVASEYDAIFFDTHQYEVLSMEIRKKDNLVRLVQIIDKNSVSNDSIHEIWYCLSEPIESMFLFPVLDRIVDDIRQKSSSGLLIKSRGRIMNLAFSQIEYLEVMGKTVYFHLTDGTTEESPGSFSDFESRILYWPDFIKIHRAYIINLRHVKKLEGSNVLTYSGHSVPVSRQMYPTLKKNYLCHFMYSETNSLSGEPNDTILQTAESGCKHRILLVDDEPEQQLHWSQILEENGCLVDTAADRSDAIEAVTLHHYDCIVLDVKLKLDNGFELCESLQKLTDAPVVFLSTLSDSESQTQGFFSGGIDYITKDTSRDLFWAKIETRIKLAKIRKSELGDNNLRLDLKVRRVFLQGYEVSLTTVEFDLLYLLMLHPDAVYSPTRLYGMIWGSQQWDDGQIVQLHLSQLRKKLEAVYPQHAFIETVWGKGYRYVPMS